MNLRSGLVAGLFVCCWLLRADATATGDEATLGLDRGLIVHLPLAGDACDRVAPARQATVHGNVDWQAAGPASKKSAGLKGRDAWLELPADTLPRLGANDFTLAAWVHTDAALSDVPGDILSQYDSPRKRGFHLTLKSNAGVTTNQANYRHLQFGIDNDRAGEWIDCGRPGESLLAFALAAHDGQLWAGTCEPGKNQSGRVYRYSGGQQWIDCGAPAKANSVTALAAFGGQLYAGTGKYRLGGSALPESENPNLGGQVLRYAGENRWVDCGQLPGVEAIGGLVVFAGKLYATSLYRPAGFFRYEGDTRWTACAVPDGKRVEALAVFNGALYASSYDGGHVYRFDGSTWTDLGQLGAEENSQTYSFAVYQGQLHVGTWRSGRVFRWQEPNRWIDAGRLGEELEVMGMLVHNGRLIAGTLPLAEVYEYRGATDWRRLTRLDHTPEVTYRRAWTMAEFQGRVFCSTLPSGRIFSHAVGRSAMWHQEFPPGWHHVAAVRGESRLLLYVDGRQVAQSDEFAKAEFDLSQALPLRVGNGPNDSFCGRLADVRVYERALSEAEIRQLGIPSSTR